MVSFLMKLELWRSMNSHQQAEGGEETHRLEQRQSRVTTRKIWAIPNLPAYLNSSKTSWWLPGKHSGEEVPSESLYYAFAYWNKMGKYLQSTTRRDKGRQRRQWLTRTVEAATLNFSGKPSEMDLTQIQSNQTLDLPTRQRLLHRSDHPRHRHPSKEAENAHNNRFDAFGSGRYPNDHREWSKEEIEKSWHDRGEAGHWRERGWWSTDRYKNLHQPSEREIEGREAREKVMEGRELKKKSSLTSL